MLLLLLLWRLLLLLLSDQFDQFLELAMITLSLGDMQQQLLQIANIPVLLRLRCQLLKVAMQQGCIVRNVKFFQRLHQMILTQFRRGQAHHQRFSRKALLGQLFQCN